MLNPPDIVRYLLARDLIAPRDIVDGPVVVSDISSRNRNYRVQVGTGRGYMLKQAIDPDGRATLAREAAVYERLRLVSADLALFLPHCYAYDAAEGLLVLEFVQGAETFRSHHAATRHFSTELAAGLGRALGLLHRSTSVDAVSGSEEGSWILNLQRPDSYIFREASSGALDVIRIIQQAPGLRESIDRLRASWIPTAFVHADVKWDNCLAVSPESADGSVKLIDWELAMIGDPGWDIGSALGQYLSFWISVPFTGEMIPERFPELASFPLDWMKPALNACWSSYADAVGLPPSLADEQLARATEFAAARLVQTGFEAAQMSQQITSPIVLHLQVAQNLLERPLEAARRLLGIRRPYGLTGTTRRSGIKCASLSDYLTKIAAELPPVLFPERNICDMGETVSDVPWAPVSVFGFERPLGDERTASDVAFATTVGGGGRDLLNGRHPLIHYSLPWPPIAEFCSLWNSQESLLFNSIDHVWFEYDVGSASGRSTRLPVSISTCRPAQV